MVPPLSCHFSVYIIPSCGGGGGGGGGGVKQQLYTLRFCSVFSDLKGLHELYHDSTHLCHANDLIS
jgi:hypothetical protein